MATTLILGGNGFIGRRLIGLLSAQGEDVACLDIAAPSPEAAVEGVQYLRGDLRAFDEVVAAMSAVRPQRVVNLAYMLGSDHPPHVAMKLNIVGMDNCFEASRITGVEHVVFGSSLAVNGEQRHFGERLVTEDDQQLGRYQYATHKIFNEWQAQDYREKHGMQITAVRPANVTGHDKVFGSVDHVQVIVNPALGKPVSFPFADTMRSPVHVDDVADVFTRVTMADKPQHPTYNTGGHATSLGQLADLVRELIPDADISFDEQTGGKEHCTNWLIDNSRLRDEFGVSYPPFRERVIEIINAVRADNGLDPIAATS